MRQCRFCHQEIGDTDRTCPHCGKEFFPWSRDREAAAPPTSAPPSPGGLKRCPFCAEEIQGAAIICKHCGRHVDGSVDPSKVTVTGIDPFAAYHTNIQGKRTGRITVVGYLGIGVGILFVVAAGVALTQARDGGEGAFVIALFGVGFVVASYLWARR